MKGMSTHSVPWEFINGNARVVNKPPKTFWKNIFVPNFSSQWESNFIPKIILKKLIN
jgi:hypothetical protein